MVKLLVTTQGAYDDEILRIAKDGEAKLMSSINFGRHAPNCVLTDTGPGFSDGHSQWFGVTIKATTGAFHGQTADYITLPGLEMLRTELENLYKTLKGKIEFGTLEDRFTMTLSCDVMGHMRLDFQLYDETARLVFSNTEVDQSYLPALIEEVKEVVAELTANL